MTEQQSTKTESEPTAALEEAQREVVASVGSLVDDILDDPDQFHMQAITIEDMPVIDGSEIAEYRTTDGSSIRLQRHQNTMPEALDPHRIFKSYFALIWLAETGDAVQVVTNESLSKLNNGITSAVYGDGVAKTRDESAAENGDSLGGIQTVIELFRETAQK
jgi:hypothetical protein